MPTLSTSQAPVITPYQAPPTLGYKAPTIGAAPTATPYGDFVAPSAGSLGSDPGVQFRMEQANKGANRSAAARGTLFSGGFQSALAKLNQGLASQEYGNVFDRALSTYGANRATSQQNYGNSLASYQAGTGAALDASRLALQGDTAAYDRADAAGRRTWEDARENTLAADAVGRRNDLTAYQAEQDALDRSIANAHAAGAAPGIVADPNQPQSLDAQHADQAAARQSQLEDYARMVAQAREQSALNRALPASPAQARRPLPGSTVGFGRVSLGGR